MPARSPDAVEAPSDGPAARLLLTARLRLVAPHEDQAVAIVDFYARNREHFAPWDPPTDADFYSADFHRRALHNAAQAFAEGRAFRYWMTPIGDPTRVIGSIHFSNVVRGAFHSCVLGYALDQEHEGQALMTEALRCAIGEVFSPHVNLHRIQAAFRPENWRSAEVLKRLGFTDEGLAPDYLFIDGMWRVHRITSLRNPAFVLPAGWVAR